MKSYFSNWNFMRFVRLALAIMIIVQGIQMREWLFIVLGSLFSLMPLLNIGCCGTSGCNTRVRKNNGNITEEIAYEEVK